MKKKFKATLVVFLVVVLGCFSNIFAATNQNNKLKKITEAKKSVRLLDNTNDNGVDQYTKLLMHMDDMDNDTFKDERGQKVENTGVTLDINNKKFGNGSAKFNGSSYLSLKDSDDWNFGSEDFTIDCWVNFSNYSRQYIPIETQRDGSHVNYSHGVEYDSTNHLLIFQYSSDGLNPKVFSKGYTFNINIWYRITIARNNTNLFMFVNGVLLGTFNIGNDIIYNSTHDINIGMYGGETSTGLEGNIDEFSLSKGIARWVPINNINLNKDTDSLILNDEIKGTDTLTAEVTPDNVANKTVKWTSSDEKIVYVDPVTGKITAKGIGKATITATTTDGTNLSKSCVVTVTEPTIITLDKTTYSINVGDTGKITASVTPAEQAVAWSSSDNSIATVDDNGNIKGVSAGTAIITATTADGKTESCTVTVKDKETGKSKLTLYMNDKTIREFYLTQDEIDDFVDWYTSKVKGEVTVQPYYVFNVSVPGKSSTKKSYVWFMKIESFEVE